jgi:5-methyltetrahydropteroyltriglutamate--homocysteine methyltransferase
VVTTAVPKQTIPSPNMVHYRGGPAMIDPAVYPDVEEFWTDLAAAYADEVARLAALGCTYLQFDDTSLAYLNDPVQRAEIAARGDDAEHSSGGSLRRRGSSRWISCACRGSADSRPPSRATR